MKTKIALNPGQSGHLLASIYLYDLGPAGTGTPVLIQSRVDEDLAVALPGNKALLTLDGSNNGGSAVLDNFSLSGQEALGIGEQQLASGVSVPGQISGAGLLRLTSSLGKQVSYQLYDNSGALIRQGFFMNQVDLDCSMLPAGMYVIRLGAENSFLIRKLPKY